MKLWETIKNVNFVGPLKIVEVEEHGNPTDYWVVTDEYALLWEDANGTKHVETVPQWYVTDFASTGVARRLIHPMDEDIRKSAPVHDRQYECHSVPQRTADALLYYSMRKRGAPYRRAWAAWLAVRSLGRWAYASGPARKDERQRLAGPYIVKAAKEMAVVEAVVPEAASSTETVVTVQKPATGEAPAQKKVEVKP